MKQFFVFVYSHYSQASMNCDKIIKSLPPDVKFNYLCVDNPENRKIILNDSTLDINMVPCLLIVNTLDGRITKYDGKKCLDYLLQYKNQQTPIVEPLPISVPSSTPAVMLQPVQHVPVVVQQTQPVVAQPVQAIPVTPAVAVPQKKINLPPPPVVNNDADESFSNPPDANQTSSLSLLDDDDQEMDYGAPPPPSMNKKRMMAQQQAPPPQPKAKPSLLAQATAMQKSRLADEKNSLN